ncbi:MAG: lysophospholipid acyltransferase family protein [Bradymonadia bacterium]|jgi:1-acyl-sn-glycerol-3-phosphate acyltransferase
MRALLSVYGWALMSLTVVLCFVVTALVLALTWPLDRGRYWAGRAARVTGTLAARGNPFLRFSWGGTPPEDPRKPYVVVSNHESNFDPFLLAFLPWEMKFLSKKSLFRVPFFGWAMWLAGDLSVDRGDKSNRGRALDGVAAVLKRKVSVLVFPEGTRSRTDEMLPFRHGGFRLAIEQGVDVLPLGIAGTRDALPKGTWKFSPARAVVLIGAPISTAGLTPEDAPALAERVQAAVLALRTDARARLAG